MLKQREFDLQAATLTDAFERLRVEQPGLALHIFDESGQLRRHVLCFVSDVNTRWLDPEDWRRPLRDGQTLLFMQAVSGG